MLRYVLRRLILIVPTIWAIITVNFFIVQIAPGGPVDQAIAQMSGMGPTGAMERISGAGRNEAGSASSGTETGARKNLSPYRGSRGLDPEVVAAIRQRYGFDKPLLVRYLDMLRRYLTFDLGDSLFKGKSVLGLVAERLPVFHLPRPTSTLIIYLVSIPLGIRKAVRHGSRFDVWTSSTIVPGQYHTHLSLRHRPHHLPRGAAIQDLSPFAASCPQTRLPGLLAKIGDYLWHMPAHDRRVDRRPRR